MEKFELSFCHAELNDYIAKCSALEIYSNEAMMLNLLKELDEKEMYELMKGIDNYEFYIYKLQVANFHIENNKSLPCRTEVKLFRELIGNFNIS